MVASHLGHAPVVEKKLAVVTGGSGGIGAHICTTLIRANYDVVCYDLQEHPQENVKSIIGSVTGVQVEADLGDLPVDVLINTAGVTDDAFLHKMSDQQWGKVISVNLDGVYNTTRVVINGMREREYGRIVNISSINAARGQFGQCNYAASKAGVHAFTMSLAQESASKNIMVNTVSPGYIKTPMTDKMPEQMRNSILKMIPAGRVGLPEDVTRAVMFLIAESNTYITGANIPVNGALFTSF